MVKQRPALDRPAEKKASQRHWKQKREFFSLPSSPSHFVKHSHCTALARYPTPVCGFVSASVNQHLQWQTNFRPQGIIYAIACQACPGGEELIHEGIEAKLYPLDAGFGIPAIWEACHLLQHTPLPRHFLRASRLLLPAAAASDNGHPFTICPGGSAATKT